MIESSEFFNLYVILFCLKNIVDWEIQLKFLNLYINVLFIYFYLKTIKLFFFGFKEIVAYLSCPFSYFNIKIQDSDVNALFFLWVCIFSQKANRWFDICIGFCWYMLNGAVEVLKEIGKKLGKKDWDFGVDPCSGEGGNWIVWDGRKGIESNVTCDCTFNHNSSCHVVSMYSSLFLFPHSICSLC